MTFRAVNFGLVYAGMTGRASKRRMFALILLQLLKLIAMARTALHCEIALHRNLERCMRIRVTTDTFFEFEVRFTLMALTAGRNRFFHFRRMSHVTIRAGNQLVLFPVGSDISRRTLVAFGAILSRQSPRGIIIRRGTFSAPHENKKKYRCRTYKIHTPGFLHTTPVSEQDKKGPVPQAPLY